MISFVQFLTAYFTGTLDVEDNRISGSMPSEIGSLVELGKKFPQLRIFLRHHSHALAHSEIGYGEQSDAGAASIRIGIGDEFGYATPLVGFRVLFFPHRTTQQ